MNILSAAVARKESQRIIDAKHTATHQEIFDAFSDIVAPMINYEVSKGNFSVRAKLDKIYKQACYILKNKHCTIDELAPIGHVVDLFTLYCADILQPAGYYSRIDMVNHNTQAELIISWKGEDND